MTDMTPREAVELLSHRVNVTGDDFLEEVREAIATLSALADRAGWQPIDTAPKDGTRVLGWFLYDPVGIPKYCSNGIDVMRWTDHNGGGWVHYWGGQPTHWMPLPAAPGASHE